MPRPAHSPPPRRYRRPRRGRVVALQLSIFQTLIVRESAARSISAERRKRLRRRRRLCFVAASDGLKYVARRFERRPSKFETRLGEICLK